MLHEPAPEGVDQSSKAAGSLIPASRAALRIGGVSDAGEIYHFATTGCQRRTPEDVVRRITEAAEHVGEFTSESDHDLLSAAAASAADRVECGIMPGR
jgi:hypothetical protein